MEVSGRRPVGNDVHKSGMICDPCKGEKEEEPAVSYCIVCNEFLCQGCRKAHARAKATKSHLLLDQDSMPKQKPTSDKESMCPKHNDKPLDFYCKTQNQFCCSLCATIDHNQCNIQHIDDIGTVFHKSNEFIALEKSTANLIRLLQETKGTATRNAVDVSIIHANFVSEIHHFRTEINNALDSLEKAALREIQIVKDNNKRAFDLIATKCDSMLSDIRTLSSRLEELIKCNQKRQLVICTKNAAETVNTYTDRVNELSKQNKIKDYKFELNEKIRQFLDSLDSLGHMKEIKDDRETANQTTCPDLSAQASHQPTASYVGSIDVRHLTDKEDCWITGGVILDESKLALVDRGNFSVKVVGIPTNALLSCIKLPIRPWDITCVNWDQIAVTCSDQGEGKLVFLEVGKSLSALKELDIGRHCQGVANFNNTFIVSFDHPESSVKIFDMKGKVLKTFKTNKAGDDLFSHPLYMSLSADHHTVFVSDWYNHTVTSLTLDGTVQQVYTEDSLKRPHGLTVDRNDNVYIAGCWSHNVHQLSTERNQSRVILDSARGVVWPCVVTYCKTQHRLYISVEKNGCEEVSVYQLHT